MRSISSSVKNESSIENLDMSRITEFMDSWLGKELKWHYLQDKYWLAIYKAFWIFSSSSSIRERISRKRKTASVFVIKHASPFSIVKNEEVKCYWIELRFFQFRSKDIRFSFPCSRFPILLPDDERLFLLIDINSNKEIACAKDFPWKISLEFPVSLRCLLFTLFTYVMTFP